MIIMLRMMVLIIIRMTVILDGENRFILLKTREYLTIN